MSKYDCDSCADEIFFNYYGTVTPCADCSDHLSPYDTVMKKVNKLEKENNKLTNLVADLHPSMEFWESGVEMLTIILRKKSPLHRLWNKLHKEKYPEEL